MANAKSNKDNVSGWAFDFDNPIVEKKTNKPVEQEEQEMKQAIEASILEQRQQNQSAQLPDCKSELPETNLQQYNKSADQAQKNPDEPSTETI